MTPADNEENASAPLVDAIAQKFPGAIQNARLYRGQTTLFIQPGLIRDVCRFLKTDRQFARLCGITAVDRYPMEPRLEVVYLLHSIECKERVRLICALGGDLPEISSVAEIWPGANWYEREVFDLFGVKFTGHPDLKRIMMPADWEGHPLRKDFPVHGGRYGYQDE